MPVDLRSDTVTRPSPAMRRAMAEAEVGDDVFREDPTVRQLEELTAGLLGKPKALFVPSGTMANQLALLTQTRPGDEVIVGAQAHIAWHEAGAGGAWAGVQFSTAGSSGTFTALDLQRVLKPPNPLFPRQALVCLENTHNQAGGRLFPHHDVLAIAEVARSRGLALHLDGARLWHAAAASCRSEATLAEPFDTISVCYSKGLGAPVGSALVGDEASIERAWRFRKMLGGGMRQAGVVAAGALFALRHQRDDLSLDHDKAKQVADLLGGRGVDVVPPETNIVLLHVAGAAEALARRAAERGVQFFAMSPDRARLVLHRDVDRESAMQAAATIADIFDELRPTGL